MRVSSKTRSTRPAAAQGLGHVQDALGRGRGDRSPRRPRSSKVVVAVGAQPRVSLLQRPHGLLHAPPQRCEPMAMTSPTAFMRVERRVGGALELLEGKARNLHHAVVDGRLEAGRRGRA